MTMPDSRLIFPVQVEGLLRGLEPDVTPRLKQRLKAAGLDLDAKLPPAWPAERLREWLDACADEVYPGQPREQALRAIGRRFIEGWQRTLIGAASAKLLKLVGPRRTLERLTRAFRTGDNFSETSVLFPSDRVGVVTVRSQRLPHYIAGILDGGVAMLEVDGRVAIEDAGDGEHGSMRFRIEW